jgi:hypothetical protein
MPITSSITVFLGAKVVYHPAYKAKRDVYLLTLLDLARTNFLARLRKK